jgi:ureidoacrylate peracid hydrolase
MSARTADLRTRLSRRTALVVVDMQKDYCVPGGIIDRLGGDISGSATLAKRLQFFIGATRGLVDLTLFVRTEIPAGLRSQALVEQYSRSSLKRKIMPDLTDWYGVRPAKTDAVVTKQRYSPFVDTPFASMLRAARIETLIVTGVTTEVCVESTVRDAFTRDYSVVVASDCTQGSTAERNNHALAIMDVFFARVASSKEILSALEVRRHTSRHDS